MNENEHVALSSQIPTWHMLSFFSVNMSGKYSHDVASGDSVQFLPWWFGSSSWWTFICCLCNSTLLLFVWLEWRFCQLSNGFYSKWLLEGNQQDLKIAYMKQELHIITKKPMIPNHTQLYTSLQNLRNYTLYIKWFHRKNKTNENKSLQIHTKNCFIEENVCMYTILSSFIFQLLITRTFQWQFHTYKRMTSQRLAVYFTILFWN